LGHAREVERLAAIRLDQGDELEDALVDVGFQGVDFSARVL
jgi:hypothetical protein